MLIVTRKCDETIVINERTTIRILKTTNGRCKIGIEAPDDEIIRRGELMPQTEQLLQQTAAGMGVDHA